MNISKISVMETSGSANLKIKTQNTCVQNTCATPIAVKTPSLGTLQAYYIKQSPAFGRLTAEHLQHGAYVDEAKDVLFNLFTFPDVKEVSVVIQKKVNGVVKEFTHALTRDNKDSRIFSVKLNSHNAKAGEEYAFKITGSNGESKLLPDPYAKRKIDYKSPFSVIHDHSSFRWSEADKKWFEGKDARRISRLGDSGMTSVRNARILEINIPTFTKDGTFEAAKAKIDKMIKQGLFKEDGKGAFNTIEIMPVETTNAPSWAYDGVYKAAPLEALGGPDGLKSLVDYAHSKGINMIMDAVPNHFGTDYNPLRQIGPYCGADGMFGPKPNFENDFANNKHARDFITEVCALNWLRDYHFDGLRLDLTHDMDSNYALKQIIEEVNYHQKHAFVILEDGRYKTDRLTTLISKPNDLPESVHAEQIKNFDTNNVDISCLGANAHWSYEAEHAMNKTCSGNQQVSVLAGELISGTKRGDLFYGMRQSHDEMGNEDGIGPVVAMVRDKLGMFFRVVGSSRDEQGQRAAQGIQEVLIKYASGEYQKFSPEQRLSYLKTLNIVKDITPYELGNALNVAIAQNKVSVGITWIMPQQKMQFREISDITPFRFFREFAGGRDEDWAARQVQKGYPIDGRAREISTLDSIPYSSEYQAIIDKTNKFQVDLNGFAMSNPALHSGYIMENSTVTHDGSKVLGMHFKKDASEVFSVSNFDSMSYSGNYGIKFPQGKWRQVINSDDVQYAGSGKYTNNNIIESDGINNRDITLSGNSLLVFEKIG